MYEPSPTVRFGALLSARGSHELRMIERAQAAAVRGSELGRLQLASALSMQSRDGSVAK
jgi:hypothetical protein